MIAALGSGQGWLTNEAKLNRLIDLSVGENQRNQAEQVLKAWQAEPREIEYMGALRIQIAQYTMDSRQAAIEKLLQFPRGSTFIWKGYGSDSEQKAFEEISKASAGHGITIVRNTAPTPTP